MKPGKAKGSAAETLVQRAVRGELDEGQVVKLCKECPELVTLALLAAVIAPCASVVSTPRRPL